MKKRAHHAPASKGTRIIVWLLSAATLMPAHAQLQAQLSESPYWLSSPSDINRPARSAEKEQAYRGGIADALIHVDPSFRADRLPPLLGAEKVRRAVVMPVPNEGLSNRIGDGTEQKIQLAQNNAKQIKVMCGGDYLSNWLSDTEKYGAVEAAVKQKLTRLEADLDSGSCLGVGELGLLHFNKMGTQNVIQIRFDAPLVLQVIDAIGRRGRWLQLHAEPREPNGRSHDKEVWSALALWTSRQPNLKIMMSHTGMTSAAHARRLLESYPNLYFSIKLMSSRVDAWRHLEPLLNGEGELFEDWAQLMETMPGRFVIGSDAKFGQSGHESEGEEGYGHMIRKFRRMLGTLDANTARQIASENVKRIYGFGKDAADAEPDL